MLDAHSDLVVYECDGFVIEKNCPTWSSFRRSTERGRGRSCKLCNEHDVPFVPRGAGTSLAGGCLPVGGGVMIVLTRMKRDPRDQPPRPLRRRRAGRGQRLAHQRASKGTGYHYAPDPSSQGACTIGGNVATNSGGPHTLKYGVTVNHVLGVEVVLADGAIVQIGGPAEDTPGLDLTGAIVGSEGTLGIVTKIWVRLTRNPARRAARCSASSIRSTTPRNAISDIIGAGIIPAALEMMDQGILVAVEAAFHFGFPLDAEAMLLIEVDGLEVGPRRAARSDHRASARSSGAREVRLADDAKERLLLWKCRKQAFGAIGRLSPSYCTQDGVVPRTKLPHILRRITRDRRRSTTSGSSTSFTPATATSIRSCCSTSATPEQVKRVLAASDEILDECIACGGSVTGEHGIGVEKINFMNRMFTDDDLDVMARLARRVQSRRPAEPRQDAAHRRRLRHGTNPPRPPGGAVESNRMQLSKVGFSRNP